MFCKNCGANMDDDARFCPSCGANVNDNRPYYESPISNDGQKDWLTTLLLCVFLGGIGIHRFYTGHTAIGVVQLITLGGCGIWSLIDLIMIVTNSYTDVNGRPLKR
jgi:hypothetical protein